MVGQLICNSLYTYFGPGRLYRIMYFTYFRKFLLSSPCGGGGALTLWGPVPNHAGHSLAPTLPNLILGMS